MGDFRRRFAARPFGFVAVGRLRMIDPDAKAIVCSGHSNDLIMDKFQMYGFRGADVPAAKQKGN